MAHKVSETTDKKAMRESRPFGPGFPEAKVERAARMEVWGSSFSDAGADYCEFRLFDDAGRQIASARVEGF